MGRDLSEDVEGVWHVGVLVPEELAKHSERVAVEGLGCGVVPFVIEDTRQAGQSHSHVWVLIPEELSPHGQGLAEKGLGPVVVALLGYDKCQEVKGLGDVGMLVSEELAPHRERLAVAGLGSVVVVLAIEHLRQVVEARRHIRVLVSQHPLPDLKGLPQQPLRLVVESQVVVDVPHRVHEGGPHLGLLLEFPPDPFRPLVQHLSCRHRVPPRFAGIRDLEEIDQERRHTRRLVPLRPEPPALHHGAHRESHDQ